jgi:hypothetical protein
MPNPKVKPPVAPPYLAKVPKTIIRRLEASELLSDALMANKHISMYGPVIAFSSIESALAAAKRQNQRISRGKAIRWKQRRSNRKRASIFDDVHFYVICWTRIAKLGRFIVNATRFRRAGLVLRRYHKELTHMIDARDHLEHFEERLPGGKKQRTLKNQNDLFNIAGENMTFGGQQFDIGPRSVALLQAIVLEFRTAVLFDSLDLLAEVDPNRLKHHLQQAARDRMISRLMKPLEQQFGSKPELDSA